jgi:hypothetical protein
METVEMKTLLDVAKTFDDAGVFWWVTDGTCLSLIRSGRIEEWQKDIDVGVWDVVEAEAALRAAGWADVATYPNQVKATGKLDVCGHRVDGDRVVVDLQQGVSYGFSAYLFEQFGEVEVDGYTFRTPHPVGDYLVEHYGDWRTPVEEWDWMTPPCLVAR